jgi:hypothetical protein
MWSTDSAGSTPPAASLTARSSALGWRGGDRPTLTAGAGVMVARRDPGGMVTMPARPHLVIPAAVRHRWRAAGR